tara:strand:+ start:1307 stop:1753 length:447 start_codon:yes stop_codon:yes gene_type:complete
MKNKDIREILLLLLFLFITIRLATRKAVAQISGGQKTNNGNGIPRLEDQGTTTFSVTNRIANPSLPSNIAINGFRPPVIPDPDPDPVPVTNGIAGCTERNAKNYNPNATINDGSCIARVLGCTDVNALNYFAGAERDDGSCIYELPTM